MQQSQSFQPFHKRVDASGGQDACWEWTGFRNKANYGQLRWKGKLKQAHRAAYEVAHGAIPQGKLICHHCDNPPCCNPAHLYAGTHFENSRDIVIRGRGKQSKFRKTETVKFLDHKELSDYDQLSADELEAVFGGRRPALLTRP